MTQRHLVVLTLEVTMLSGDAPVVVSSQLLNRQDGEDEYHVRTQTRATHHDPRKAGSFEERVLMPMAHWATEERMLLGYRCANSRMTVAVAADHNLRTTDPHEIILRDDPDLAKMVFRVDATEGKTVRIEKIVAYHSSRGLPVGELTDRCNRTLDRAARYDVDYYLAEQRVWYARFWDSADVQVGSDDPTQAAVQQAVRFDGRGIVAGAHVFGEIFRLHQFADIMEISADSAQCRIGPDGFRGRLGEVRHGQAVVVGSRGLQTQRVGAMDD